MISYAFSSRRDGDMRNSEQRARFLRNNSLDPQFLVLAQQIHGISVATVGKDDLNKKIENVDGLIASYEEKMPEVILGVRTADCMPVIFFDEKKQHIGVAHSGWKGTAANIAGEMIHEMKQMGSSLSDIHVVVGPHIQACCYDIPLKRVNVFKKNYEDTAIEYREGKYFLSLKHMLFSQLMLAGISSIQINDESRCTSCHVDQYFSYRKETSESFGEQLGFIALSR